MFWKDVNRFISLSELSRNHIWVSQESNISSIAGNLQLQSLGEIDKCCHDIKMNLRNLRPQKFTLERKKELKNELCWVKRNIRWRKENKSRALDLNRVDVESKSVSSKSNQVKLELAYTCSCTLERRGREYGNKWAK